MNSLNPYTKPDHFKDTLQNDTPSFPPERAVGPRQILVGDNEPTGADHSNIAKSHRTYVCGQKTPYPHSERIAGILDVAQHRCHHHDKQAYPEECEETTEIMIIASRVKVRHTGDIMNCVKKSVASPGLFPGGRYRMRRRGCIFRDRSRVTAAGSSISEELRESSQPQASTYLDSVSSFSICEESKTSSTFLASGTARGRNTAEPSWCETAEDILVSGRGMIECRCK